MSLAVLRKSAPSAYVNRLWASAREGRGGRRPCPACEQPMIEVALPSEAKPAMLDVCRACHFVWFDPREYEVVPALPPPPEEPPLPREARELLALHQVELIAERARGGELGAEPPDEAWKVLPGIFGLPVEHEGHPLERVPYLTWALAALVTLVSLVAFRDLKAAVESFALIPAEPFRLGGVTFLTSFLLHGGVLHLLGNMYFLLVFGDNVEDYLGSRRYLLLIGLATVMGDLVHVAVDPRRTIPLIGASGGISGIIAFYALKFPRVRLGFLLRFFWIRMPAYIALVLWVLLQLALARMQVAGTTNVSALAHLGGAGAGLVCWLVWRDE